MEAQASLRIGGLALGLAHGVKLLKPVAAGQPLRWTDVAVDESSPAVKVRKEMERLFALHPEVTLI
ncbi:MAG TPA: flagellar biosynthesis protein FlgA, partial [Burkholderiales bacterium]|nr:flagellar biosynthesis protein FlgA [Burkholderiales bacterium]